MRSESTSISPETIIHHLNDPIFILDRNGQILFYNEACKRLQRLARSEISTGVFFTEIVSKERKEVAAALISQVVDDSITETVEAEYRDRDGRQSYFQVTYSPIRQTEGENNVLVIIHDITPQKTFERKSVRLLREFQEIIENANAMIFSTDSRQYVTEWNRECVRVTHYEKNEILAKKLTGIGLDESAGQITDVLNRVLSGEPIYNFELTIRNKELAPLTILVNVTPKLNDKNDVVGALFVGQDITELTSYRLSLEQQVRDRTEKLKRALEKERELVTIKDRFVSIASHELRSPLLSIENCVRTIRKTDRLYDKEIQLLDNIDKQVDLMKNLLEDILTLERQEVQKLKAHYQSFNLLSFLEELTDEVLSNHKHSHRVEKIFSEEAILVTCDNKLLRNIYINLLVNAIKYSPDNRTIELSVSLQPDGYVRIAVQDRGIGIPAVELEKILEPFTRGSNVEGIKGTGLGLSIVKRAVDVLGGRVHLESTVNQGTKAIVWIPCSPNKPNQQ